MAVILVLVAAGSQPLPTDAVQPGVFNNGALVYPVDGGLRLDYTTDEVWDFTDYDLPWAGATSLEFDQYGRFLAYSVPGGDEPGLHLADMQQCTTQRLTQNAMDRAPAFDHEHLYFTRGASSLELDYDESRQTDPISGTPAATAFGTDMAVGEPYPGRYAYVEPPSAAHPGQYVLKLDDRVEGGGPVEVYRSPDPITGTEWNRDMNVIAFQATAADDTVQIFFADVAGSPIEVTQFTDAAPNAVSPAFSPNGRSIAYFVGPTDMTSGQVVVHELATGEEAVQTDAARGRLEWQPVSLTYRDYPPFGHPGQFTQTVISLSEPSFGPGDHYVEVRLDSQPADDTWAMHGSVAVSLDGAEPQVVELENEIAVLEYPLEAGDHLVTADYTGECRFRSSSGEFAISVVEGGPYRDIASSPFRTQIQWLVNENIANGCTLTEFCPEAIVTREEMASHIDRALDLPRTTVDHFTDDNNSIYEASINRVAEAGITLGCRALPKRFCAHDQLTRGQAASLIARALELAPGTLDHFFDDNGLTHESDINRMAEASITDGCEDVFFCPYRLVTREEVAALLYRALAES